MDPDATLKLLHDALLNGPLEDARDHAAALRGWMAKGGFTPKVTYDQFAAILGYIIITAEDQSDTTP